ncbi:hypothetical protein KI387_040817, partial [Taxus chinensis]
DAVDLITSVKITEDVNMTSAEINGHFEGLRQELRISHIIGAPQSSIVWTGDR